MQQVANRNGFSLVELAVSLVVIGLLIGLGTAMVGPLLSSIKVRESRENLGAAVESINGWAAANNRLPDTTTAATSVTLVSNVVRNSADAWTRPLIYLYDTNLAPATATQDTICGRKTTFITLTDSSTGALVQNVAYLVLSQGEDAVADTTIGGVAVTSGPRAATTAVAADTANDLVRWTTLGELQQKIGCKENAANKPLRIVNNELPPATVGSPYPNAAAGASVAFTVDGGATPGTLRWCLESPAAVPLPTGLAFTPLLTGAIRVAPNSCNATNPLAEASWISSSTLTISGTPAAGTSGAYSLTLYVRDNSDSAAANDNVTSKSFVLTVNQ
ncbi:MAG: putative Ig domain-containing protein [Trichlorobacter sp.]